MARKGFWGKFDDLMDSLPGYIEEQTEKAKKSGNYTESNTVTINNISTSTTTVRQNGKKIVVQAKNGKTTITVDGKEYVEKK